MFFPAPIQASPDGLEGFTFATATDSSGNTSEFSACIAYALRGEMIFLGGFE